MASTDPPPDTSTQEQAPPSQTTQHSSTNPSTSTPSELSVESQNVSSSSQSKRSNKPFPSVTGSCMCSAIRYRLLTSPLFVYACHCTDCQKTSGTAFATYLNIEIYNIALLPPAPTTDPLTGQQVPTKPVQPVVVTQTKPSHKHIECPNCHVQLWSQSWLGPGIADVRVGTLDWIGLFEPDVHSFVDSKVSWLRLPEGARTTKGQFEHREHWPKSSLRRLEICLARIAALEQERKTKLEEVVGAHVDGQVTVRRGPLVSATENSGVVPEGGDGGAGGDGEKTPTASGDVGDGSDGESDEAFEKRYKETERVLQARLEKLSERLKEEEEGKTGGTLEEMAAKLDLGDGKDEEKEK